LLFSECVGSNPTSVDSLSTT
ncbi:hypothetical protein KIPB_013883, partial [Kipferlia bialata]